MASTRSTEDLSREVSYALRHAPGEYGLALDEGGWASLDGLVRALRGRPGYAGLTADDVADMVRGGDKPRHEIRGGLIRALYGHSTPADLDLEPAQPPATLYHGTARRFLPSIFESGLKPGSRQFVHLAEDEQTALEVGRRRDAAPALLRVDTAAAAAAGIAFYHGGGGTWLADGIPPHCLSQADGCPDA